MPGCGKNNTSPAGAVVAAEWGVAGRGWGVWDGGESFVGEGSGVGPVGDGCVYRLSGFVNPLPAMEPLGGLVGLALGADGGRMRCQVAGGGDQDVRPLWR